MSCLIIKNDGIGDLILASGLISSVGELFNGEVDLVTCSDNREVAEGIQHLRDLFFCSRDSIRFIEKSNKKWVPFLKFQRKPFLSNAVPSPDRDLLKTLSRKDYDFVICLRRYIRQSSLVLMRTVKGANKHCAWQFPMNTTGALARKLSKGWSHYEGSMMLLSELHYNQSFLEAILSSELDPTPRLSFCRKQTVNPKSRRIALGIGGGSTNWPFGNWVELGMRLASGGWKLLLLGGENVADLGEQIAAKVPDAENQVGRLSWRETSELLSGCEGYVGNDTGLSHFASLILQKVLVILGGGTFSRFFPWPSNNNQSLIFHGLDCYDCGWDCKFTDRFCLSLIQPRDVERVFYKILNSDVSVVYDINEMDVKYRLAWRKCELSDYVNVSECCTLKS